MQSRKKNSVKNIISGFISKVLVFLFAFACRTIFIKILGAEYTGINGLYSNILSVLALADLGIGNVFVFTLYKHLAKGNKEEIAIIIATFKGFYITIGMAILVLGLLFIPFLPIIVHSELTQKYVVLYFVLSLLNSVCSYFFVYKTTILTADQKKYIVDACTTISQCLMYLLQIVYLIYTKDFTGYLIIQILCTIGKNYILSRIADKQYQYITSVPNNAKLDKLNFSSIWNNLKATFLYKVCNITLSNTTNILISMLIGTVFVGYYSNYFLLIQYVGAYVYILTSGLHASLGNFQVNSNRDDSYSLFNTLNLVYSSIGCVIVAAFTCCIQPFVTIWIGDEYLLDFECVIAILLKFYIDVVLSPVNLYRETLGLFTQVKYILVPAVIINIVLSVFFSKIFGLSGILFAITVSQLVTCCWYEPMIIYRYFEKNVFTYFRKQVNYFFMVVVSSFCSYYICSFVSVNILGFLYRTLLAILVSVVFIILFNMRTQEFNNMIRLLSSLLAKRKVER